MGRLGSQVLSYSASYNFSKSKPEKIPYPRVSQDAYCIAVGNAGSIFRILWSAPCDIQDRIIFLKSKLHISSIIRLQLNFSVLDLFLFPIFFPTSHKITDRQNELHFLSLSQSPSNPIKYIFHSSTSLYSFSNSTFQSFYHDYMIKCRRNMILLTPKINSILSSMYHVVELCL